MPVVAFLEKQAKRIAMPRGPRQIAWIVLLLAAGWFDYSGGPRELDRKRGVLSEALRGSYYAASRWGSGAK